MKKKFDEFNDSRLKYESHLRGVVFSWLCIMGITIFVFALIDFGFGVKVSNRMIFYMSPPAFLISLWIGRRSKKMQRWSTQIFQNNFTFFLPFLIDFIVGSILLIAVCRFLKRRPASATPRKATPKAKAAPAGKETTATTPPSG